MMPAFALSATLSASRVCSASVANERVEQIVVERFLEFAAGFEIVGPANGRDYWADDRQRQPDQQAFLKRGIGLDPGAVDRQVGDLAERPVEATAADLRIKRNGRAGRATPVVGHGRLEFGIEEDGLFGRQHGTALVPREG